MPLVVSLLLFAQPPPPISYPGDAHLHPTIHFAPDVVANQGGWHDIAGAFTSNGIHHIFQGTGWNHAQSTDLVSWKVAPHGPDKIHETYKGMSSYSDPCSGFVVRDDATGDICAGFRQCGSDKGVSGMPHAWDVPLELRCAMDDTLSGFSTQPEYLFNVSWYRPIPYDPARPWRDVDGNWYVLISMDGCNATTQALPCELGGELHMWRSPTLRGPKADWQPVGAVFRSNETVLGGSTHLTKEFVTIDYIGRLAGDPSGAPLGTRLFLNNVGGNGGGEGCCSGTTSYFVVEQSAPGGVFKETAPQGMADWGAFAVRPSPLPYAPEGAVIPSSKWSDFWLNGGASAANAPADDATSGLSLRSGNPGGVSTLRVGGGVVAPGHSISAVALSFRYVAGYTPAPGENKTAPTVRVLLTDEAGVELLELLQTTPLGEYSYDAFEGYSPPIYVHASSLSVPNDALVCLVLEVTNNERNLQIPLDDKLGGFGATVSWAPTAEKARRPSAARPWAPTGLALLDGTASRGLSMARTLGSDESDQVTQPGRRILIGWAGPADAPVFGGHASAQSLPRALSLAKDRSLLQAFVPELQALRGAELRASGAAAAKPLAGGLQAEVLAFLPSGCGAAGSACGVAVLGEPDAAPPEAAAATVVSLSIDQGLVIVDATSQGNTAVRGGPLPAADATTGGWLVHVIVDHSIIELIVSNATAFIAYAVPTAAAGHVSLIGLPDDPTGAELRVWPLKNASHVY